MVRRRKSPGNGKLVRVGASALGQGVFAARSIRRRETIGQVRGLLIRDPWYSSDYCVHLDTGSALEPDPPFRFLNHSCDPNCEIFTFDGPDDDEQLWLAALREIERGEELTIDYAWSAEGAIPCACRSPLCRGWIVSREDLPRLLERLSTQM